LIHDLDSTVAWMRLVARTAALRSKLAERRE
jgi:hypothetical protein